MPQINVLISEEAFIVKKGLQFILNEFENYNYTFYNRENNKLTTCFSIGKVDILICNNNFYEFNKSIIDNKKPELIIIDLINKNHSKFFIHTLDTDKSAITRIIQDAGKNKGGSDEKIEGISEREITVVKCIAQGMTNKEIADSLFISQHTVITHRKNITRKLGIKTVSGLTVYAILNNIIDINEVS